jgi:hypothetical protein
MDFENLQFANCKYDIVGTQDQEKMNVIKHVMTWGTNYCVFASGIYGASSPGNWNIDWANAAGYTYELFWDVQQGYYPSFFSHIYGEMIAKIGRISSGNGSSFDKFSINFVDPFTAKQFIYGQIEGSGVRYENGQFRMYGTGWPVNINNYNGYNSFINVGWETEPNWNTDYPGTGPKFEDNFINQFQMDSIKQTLTPIDSTAPGGSPIYIITKDSASTGGYTATIKCVGNELQRVKKGLVLVAYDNLSVTQGTIGVVISTDSSSFTIGYVSSQIISGNQYYLFLKQ